MERKGDSRERESNFKWLMNQNLASYKGCWVAVVDRKIVSKGADAKAVIEDAYKKFPEKVPFVALIPSEQTITI
jgi:hypothetical protein